MTPPELLRYLGDENVMRALAIRQHLAELQAAAYRGATIPTAAWTALRTAGDELEDLMACRMNRSKLRPKSP
jgi:hypothetical protein